MVKTPGEAGETYDYVVLANKAIGQSSHAEQIAPAVDEDKTTIVIMQNGVGNEDPFRKAFPKTTIISGVVRFISIRVRSKIHVLPLGLGWCKSKPTGNHNALSIRRNPDWPFPK